MKNCAIKIGVAGLISFNACQQITQKQSEEKPEKEQKMNILFIGVDDLRPELGCYGENEIKSPNIDELASQGVVFTNAYCNSPVSGASRTSLLTGVRPKHDTIFEWNARADEDIPDLATLPEYLKQNGYYTISNGKIFHDLDDSPESWSEDAWQTDMAFPGYALEKNKTLTEIEKQRGPATECANVHDTVYADGKIAQKTINDLIRLKKSKKPFFLAAGFMKPHLPFNCPKKYWNLYNPDSITPATNQFKPENAPEQAIHNFGELRSYSDIPKKGPLTSAQKKHLKHGYYACVSYIDAQIGKVLTALDSLGMADNTIIVLWGDHGWLLAEHTLWCKQCNFNDALHAPLIIKAPNYKPAHTNALTEFVDLYPTIVDFCKLNAPSHIDGESLLPVLKNPDSKGKNEIYARFYHQISVKSGDYLYTEWYVPGYLSDYAHMKDSVYAYMLYNHKTDPDENIDISKNEKNRKIVKRLSNKLNSFYKL